MNNGKNYRRKTKKETPNQRKYRKMSE